MKRIYELPPVLGGSVEQQLMQIREYLLRLVLQLNEEGESE